MGIAELLSVIDQLSPEDLTLLKERIQQREAEVWGVELESAAADFRGDSLPEELDSIFEAINYKSYE